MSNFKTWMSAEQLKRWLSGYMKIHHSSWKLFGKWYREVRGCDIVDSLGCYVSRDPLAPNWHGEGWQEYVEYPYAELKAAHDSGQMVQARRCGDGEEGWYDEPYPNWRTDGVGWRIKPADPPKTYWSKPEHVPVGTGEMLSDDGGRQVILSAHEWGIEGHDGGYNYDYLPKGFVKWRPLGSDEWRECTVESLGGGE